ncbi:MAG: cyclodeaminase/cyclohydrolase family protein, partial [Myxococcota bacterium]
GHRDAMLRLAEDDMQAFGRVSAAYSMPRDTDEAKQARSTAIQQGLRGAMEVPVRTLQACAALASEAHGVISRANRNVISDAGIALVLMQATADAAMYNVRINAKFLKDAAYASDQQQLADEAHARTSELVGAARALVDESM